MEDNRNSIISLKDYLPEFLEGLETNENNGILTRLPPLDAVIECLFPNSLVTIGGIPSSGKTSLCLQIARNVAKNGNKVFWIGVEHGISFYTQRILEQESGISGKVIRNIKDVIDKKVLKDLLDASDRISEYGSNLILVDANSEPLTIENMKEKISEFGVDKQILIIIDSIQALSFYLPDKCSENSIDGVVRAVSQLAGSLCATIICISRKSKSLADSNSLSGLSYTYGLSFDSNVVMFLQVNKKKTDSQEVELFIAKNLRGPARISVKLHFNPEIGSFEEA
ncbi:MAG: hypothetical protein A2452_08980 [Candidatus Firestonebacteria bacterium RIFOXYC2_FULL_39_67]|nr:MAG: hypothetical protein A2536_09520 [Candidatus Firestonebacteria bacterium RIFOXYD2_FULL_39_29]OGF53583.1 MAG: hypothetical protein A2452_08980 [Candidatus Firestonebacteria bacterium RIFOXYC2_FULL_39_67]